MKCSRMNHRLLRRLDCSYKQMGLYIQHCSCNRTSHPRTGHWGRSCRRLHPCNRCTLGNRKIHHRPWRPCCSYKRMHPYIRPLPIHRKRHQRRRHSSSCLHNRSRFRHRCTSRHPLWLPHHSCRPFHLYNHHHW